MMRDVLKDERVGGSESYLGAVKVEMKDDILQASIMKNKRNLEFHNNPHMKNLIVNNLKSENQMTIENFARDLLKMIPGGNEDFMAANGHLRQRASPGQSYQGKYSAQLPAAPRQSYQAPHQGQYIVPLPAAPGQSYQVPRKGQHSAPLPAAHRQPSGPRTTAQIPQPLAQQQPRMPAQHLRPQQFRLSISTKLPTTFSPS